MDTDPMIESKHRWEKAETRVSRIDANGAHAGSETGAPAFAKDPCGRPPGAAGLGSEMWDLGKIKVN